MDRRKLLLAALVLFSVLGGRLVYQAKIEAESIRQEISAMQEEINVFNQKAGKINQEPYRPVVHAQLGDVQQELMAKVHENRISMLGVRQIRTEENGLTYELKITGSWAGIAHLMEDFHAKDALIAVRSVALGVDNGIVRAVLQYKIYTKD